MYNLRNELMHYTNDLLDGADLKAEAVAAIEQIAQYMEKDVLLHHSRPLALAYLAFSALAAGPLTRTGCGSPQRTDWVMQGCWTT